MVDTVSIGKLLLTQDNLATAEPVFVVYDKHRIYGVEGEHATGVTYVDEDGDECESGEGHSIGYVEVDQFRGAFFTRDAADAFVVRQRHNMNSPFVFVESGQHNPEWKALRDFLKGCGMASGQATPKALRPPTE